MDPHVITSDDGVARCWWGGSTPDYAEYHDTEWGFPVDDDHLLFEKLSLEGFQSGLSWLTILRKRENFRRVFHGFDYPQVAEMGEPDVRRLLEDSSIVRHRRKIESTINNARKAIQLAEEYGSLGAFFWSYEPPDTPKPLLVSESPESWAMAKELKRRGFTWVGPTTAYALMQAMGMVNDHLLECDVYPSVHDARAEFTRPARS